MTAPTESRSPAAVRLVTSGRLQLAAMVGIVCCFLATMGFATYQSRSIDRSAREIADKAMPSVQRLAAVDVALRHFAVDTVHASVAAPSDRGVLLAEAQRARGELDAALLSYRELQSYPSEHTLVSPLGDRLAALDEAAAAVRQAVGEGHSPTLALVDLRDRANGVGYVVSRLIDLNSERGTDLAVAITAARRRAVLAELALGGLSVALALFAALFTVALTRQSAAFLQARADELRRKAEELERFSSRVAHDVLSPLGTVGLALQLANKHEVLDERARPILARGLASLGRVQKLVDGLLELALAAARPKPDARASVEDGVAGVLEATTAVALERAVDVRLEPLPSPCPDVACHEGVLASLLSNLVRNAIKYMDDGAPERRVTLRVREAGERLRFEVEDSGPGVPADLRDRLFEPYVRGPETGQPGLGLGLATVKMLAETHGGAVGVRPAPGRGSCFWFELPVARAPARSPGRGTSTPRRPAAEPG
ncbi:MAG: sensor histidine kinase [Myxococcales bacterium]